MALSRINAHVGKYEKLALPDKEVREAIIALAERLVGVELPFSAIKIIRASAQIRASTVVKNQLLLHEKEILEKLALLTGKKLERII